MKKPVPVKPVEKKAMTQVPGIAIIVLPLYESNSLFVAKSLADGITAVTPFF